MPKPDFSHLPDFNELEESVLEFWSQDQTFQKSIDSRPADKSYVFYDGPPFATGLPHYGHILASTIKDVIPRFWTMMGYRVDRRWGWDCHGLPIENMIEGELKLVGGKKGIEKLGIDKFNASCRSAILRFDKEWEKIVRRIGRWVDFKNSYKTMDKDYMESVWWGFSQMYTKGLIYQGRKVVLYCPRCATPLSNFEIAMDNSYKDVEDNSVYVKFRIKNSQSKRPEYLLAWTTTPWTLPGNVGLAVQAEAEYSLIEVGDDSLWVAKDLVPHVAKLVDVVKPTIVKTIKGQELVGVEYEPLYTYMPLDGKKAHYVMTADFVSLEDGTGIVHTAAIYGEDDYRLAQAENLPCVPTLDDEGKFMEFVTPIAGVFYKKAEDWIMSDLKERNLMYLAQKHTHSYPFCYRCATPLYYSAVPAWFIDIQKMKPTLIDANEQISWYPEYLKQGRFGKGVATAPDWNISRSRYWGTPMPIWTNNSKNESKMRVISSLEELRKWAVDPSKVLKLTDIHREFLDDIEVWLDDNRTIKGTRIKEVFDCWVESASMPFAAVHYPFENKSWLDKNYPAQFISEYIAQTRAWFYCMHVISVGLFDRPAFQNALTTGTILAEDGTKMSKSKKNYPDPMLLVQKYGVDSLRLYLMSSPVMKGDNLNFSEKEVGELRKNVFVIWWNILSFYQQFAVKAPDVTAPPTKVVNVLDKWILSRLSHVTKDVTTYLQTYDVVRASRTLMDFLSELSTWYLRTSRERLKGMTDDEDESQRVAQASASSHVLGHVLYVLAQLFAPLAPFFSEMSAHTLCGDSPSIHLSDWPIVPSAWLDEKLEADMSQLQQLAEAAHAIRKSEKIKVRQPLQSVIVQTSQPKPEDAILEVLSRELNVRQVVWTSSSESVPAVSLDLDLTPELIQEGEAREAIRTIQGLRRTKGVDVHSSVDVTLPSWPKEWEAVIKRKAKVKTLTVGAEAAII